MNSKRSLITALVGLAMLATPIAAAAHDYNHYDHATHAARVAAETHPFANHAFGNGAFAVRHERHEERAIANTNAYRNYGYGRGYGTPAYVAPVYAAPAYAAAPYYGGRVRRWRVWRQWMPACAERHDQLLQGPQHRPSRSRLRPAPTEFKGC